MNSPFFRHSLLALACFSIPQRVTVSGTAMAASERDGPTLAELQARIAAIDAGTTRSASGTIIVSGADGLQNIRLLRRLADMAEAIETLTGLPPTATPDRRLHVLIAPTPDARRPTPSHSPSPLSPPPSLRHTRVAGQLIQQVILPDYATAESTVGRETCCAALLGLYLPQPLTGSCDDAFGLPAWLLEGVADVLTVDARQNTLDNALRAWQQGRMPGPRQFMGSAARQAGAAGEEDDAQRRLAQAAWVLWVADSDERAVRFRALFAHLAAGQPLDAEWFAEYAVNGDLDEQWDRWMLDQRRFVRRLGILTTADLDTLHTEWLVIPGRYAVPVTIDVKGATPYTALLPYREAAWFSAAIREKRFRIERLAFGRPANFQRLVADYARILDGLEQGERPHQLAAMVAAAQTRHVELRATVVAAGGEWRE